MFLQWWFENLTLMQTQMLNIDVQPLGFSLVRNWKIEMEEITFSGKIGKLKEQASLKCYILYALQ